MKETLEQLSETALKKFMSVKTHFLKKHLLPNFIVTIVDILRNKEKLASSV